VSTFVALSTSAGAVPSGRHVPRNGRAKGWHPAPVHPVSLRAQPMSSVASKARARSRSGMAIGRNRWKKSGNSPAATIGDR
jgi:hypothetical protein